MNVLLIGSGGREHAIALKIKESKVLNKLFISPGNPATSELGENIVLRDNDEILSFCEKQNINFVIIGPEQPLVNGLADYLRENRVTVFGPSKKAARIEGDKSFSKDLMRKYGIPTAEFKVFNEKEYNEAKDYISNSKFPLVIKASGLAAGKGVLICNSLEEALDALKIIFTDRKFGDAGNNIVIEEFMVGEEASLFAITDGGKFISLPVAQDHKRIGEGDTGLNTGGMGAYAPAPIVDEELKKRIEKEIIQPTIDALNAEHSTFIGCLYCGLMITESGPKVVEFNCRFGDPETQIVLPLLKGDFLELLYSAATGNISESAVQYNGGSAICVVAASKGYPEAYEKGFEISGLDEVKNHKNVIVYHAGTKVSDGKLITNGGRVLGVSYVLENNDLKECKNKVYEIVDKISFEGIYFRKDISDKAFK